MLYWLCSNPGPATIAFTAPVSGLIATSAAVKPGLLREDRRHRFLRRLLCERVHRRVDAQTTVQDPRLTLLWRGAEHREASVVDQAVLDLLGPRIARPQVGVGSDRGQRLLAAAARLLGGDHALVDHPLERARPRLLGALRIHERVVALGVRDQPCEQRGLPDGELRQRRRHGTAVRHPSGGGAARSRPGRRTHPDRSTRCSGTARGSCASGSGRRAGARARPPGSCGSRRASATAGGSSPAAA